MPCNVIVSKDELTSPKFCKAFAIGCNGNIETTYKGGIWAGFGSPLLWGGLQAAIKDGHDWYYGDHGYFGRGKFYRITKNAFQHNSSGFSDKGRFKRFGMRFLPFRRGNHVLICPQSKGYFKLHGCENWLEDTINEVKKHTDRPIVIRHKGDRKPIYDDLKNAHCTISHSSAAALYGIIRGVPAICTNPCAASQMAVSCISRIENLYKPKDRFERLSVLADNQWTLEEIKSGMAWKALNGTL